MELFALTGILASFLGLALTVYGVFYNGRATRALVEAIRQDIQAAQNNIQAIHQSVRAVQDDGQRRHEELLTYLKEMDRRHVELMAEIARKA
jgi:hypothetical protein